MRVKLTNSILPKLGFKADNYGLYWIKIKGKEFWIKRCKIKGEWKFDLSIGKIFEGENLGFYTLVSEIDNIIYSITGKRII